jgi:alkanesulfonate monooxygenase SsuD/methylene tetrahydromethanopterin reductase-like flavin-dependent oxidoreductase (luciferase family)
MARPTFGWIVHLVARENAKIDTLLDDNYRFINQLSGAFNSLWFEDHFHKSNSPVLESWTTLTYLAAKYPEYKLGTLVLSQSYRNPALLAKMMATLQYLTGGRYIAGIGAGWKKEEYLAYGYEYYPNKMRLEQLEEVIQILKTMWSHSPATFNGKYYSVNQAECEPLPNPPPPFLIGGGGEQITLRLVAKYADWMNVTFADHATYARKLQVLKEYCDEIGRDYSTITKSLWAYLFITKDGIPPKPDPENRFLVYGTPEQVRETLARFIEIGVEHFMVRFIDFPNTQGMELFLEEVLPKL